MTMINAIQVTKDGKAIMVQVPKAANWKLSTAFIKFSSTNGNLAGLGTPNGSYVWIGHAGDGDQWKTCAMKHGLLRFQK